MHAIFYKLRFLIRRCERGIKAGDRQNESSWWVLPQYRGPRSVADPGLC